MKFTSVNLPNCCVTILVNDTLETISDTKSNESYEGTYHLHTMLLLCRNDADRHVKEIILFTVWKLQDFSVIHI